MAWPLSRITDFIARQTKITAAFLNALQDWIIAVSTATITLKAVVVDGTGGAAATPVAGTIQASRQAGGTTTPTPAVARGQMNMGAVPLAWAEVSAAGALNGGYGIKSIARVVGLPAGAFAVKIQATGLTTTCVVASVTVGGPLTPNAHMEFGAGEWSAIVKIEDGGGTLTDAAFNFIVFGE